MSFNNTVGVEDSESLPSSAYIVQVQPLELDCYSGMQQALISPNWPFNHSPLANPSFRGELLGGPSANPPLNPALTVAASGAHEPASCFSIHDLITDNSSGFLVDRAPAANQQLQSASCIDRNIFADDSVQCQLLAESLQLQYQNLQRQNAAAINVSGSPTSDRYNHCRLNHTNSAKYSSSSQASLQQEQSSTVSDQAFNASVASCELPTKALPNNNSNNNNNKNNIGSGTRKRKSASKVDTSTLQETSSSRTNTSSPSPSQTDFKSVVEDDGKGKKRLKSPDFNSSADDNQKSEIDGDVANNSGDSMDVEQKKNKYNNNNNNIKPAVKPPADPSKSDYIHVRARRGQATDSHSLAERVRREKISERMKFLQDLVPGCSKVTGKAVMLDEIINYVQSLQRQVEFLAMKLAALNPSLQNFNLDSYFHSEGINRGSTMVLSANPEINTVGSLTILTTPARPLIQQQLQQQQIASPDNINNNNNNDNIDSFGYSDTIPQVSQTWDDELQSLVQIGFGQGTQFQKTDPGFKLRKSFRD